MKMLLAMADGFEEIEAITIFDVLKRSNIRVEMVGIGDDVITSKNGMKIICEKTIDEIEFDGYDGIILPGGSNGYKNLNKSKKLKDLIKKFNDKRKLVAAICASPLILAEMGILDQLKSTCYPSLKDGIPNYVDEKVVIDRNVITSQGPGTALDFALSIAEYLGVDTTSVRKTLLV